MKILKIFSIALFLGSFAGARISAAEPVVSPSPAESAREAAAAPAPTPVAEVQHQTVEQLCKQLDQSIARFKWKIKPCQNIMWKVGGESVQGRPLIYAEFGDPKAENTTLVFSSVHGDEITPIYIGFELVQWLKENENQFLGNHIIVAPLVNPDGFFRKPRTRMNAHGVDVNRNFATKDWPDHALAIWKKKFRSDPRRFPGASPHSEPETVFQEELISKVKPTKIISVHAPLNFLDYDGPSTLSLDRFPHEYVQKCLELRHKVRAISSGFFVGSLGNYSGVELGIPTLTLELPTADPAKAEAYWKKFNVGIKTVIEYKIVPGYALTSSR